MSASIRVHRFSAADLPWLRVQPAQAEEFACSEADLVARGRVYEVFDHSYTLRSPDGSILMCIGLIPNHARNFTAWAIMSAAAGRALVAMTHWARAYVAALDFDRMELQVRADFENGHRWARALYFAPEGVKLHWYADGVSQVTYARYGGVA